MNATTALLEQRNNLNNTKILLEETRTQSPVINCLQLRTSWMYWGMLQTQRNAVHRQRIAEAIYLDSKNNYEMNVPRKELLLERINKDSILKAQQAGQVSQISAADLPQPECDRRKPR